MLDIQLHQRFQRKRSSNGLPAMALRQRDTSHSTMRGVKARRGRIRRIEKAQ